MTFGLPRTTLNRSDLVRILSETLPEPVVPHYDLGERLGQWLDITDALALFSALSTGAAAAGRAKANSTGRGLQDQLLRVRDSLSEAILSDGVFSGESARIRFPVPLPGATAESASNFTPYHRYYLAHQRDMSTTIAALRVSARKALGERSGALRQLAELDAAFEEALAARERQLLGSVPTLLARRFAQRYEAHRAALPEAASDDPAGWVKPGGWLQAFCHDAQAVLLAELDLRLKPVAGLIAALGEDGAPTQPAKQ